MRQCPTLSGDERPLITHSISSCLCLERQREFYHKCHRCDLPRASPADCDPLLSVEVLRPFDPRARHGRDR